MCKMPMHRFIQPLCCQDFHSPLNHAIVPRYVPCVGLSEINILTHSCCSCCWCFLIKIQISSCFHNQRPGVVLFSKKKVKGRVFYSAFSITFCSAAHFLHQPILPSFSSVTIFHGLVVLVLTLDELQSSSSWPEVTIFSLETFCFVFWSPSKQLRCGLSNRASFISTLTFFTHQSIDSWHIRWGVPVGLNPEAFFSCCWSVNTNVVASNVTNYSNNMKDMCNQIRKQRQFNTLHTTQHAYK